MVGMCEQRVTSEPSYIVVMAGLVPAIHVLESPHKKDVDARD
jgi:hypothetical protein